MKFNIIYIAAVLCSFSSSAEIAIEAFGKKLTITEECTFTVKDEADNSFYCPSKPNFNHAVTFIDPVEFFDDIEKFEKRTGRYGKKSRKGKSGCKVNYI